MYASVAVFALGRRPAKPQVTIRVVIFSGSQVSVVIKDAFELIEPVSNRSIVKGRGYNRTVRLEAGRLSDERILYDERAFFKTGKKNYFFIDGRAYRGDLELLVENGMILAVNHVPLEDYLKSVVPSEVSIQWRHEALKAQAVAARTYSYYHILTNKHRLYDIPLGRQEYKGMDAEHPKTSWAVDVTFGEVMTYRGEVFVAYFHAVCGGYTADAQYVWSNSNGLPGNTPCPFCKGSRYDSWSYKVSAAEVGRLLKQNGYKINDVSRIYPQDKFDKFPRVRSVAVVGSKKFIIPVNQFRAILGFANIRSSVFEVEKKGNNFIFTGRGWGHGVGLCQYGAKALAEKGYKYNDILDLYYPGMHLKRIY